MAVSFKGRKYNFAQIRKSVVGGLVSLIAVLGAFSLVFAEFIPEGWSPVLAVVVGGITAASVFLSRNDVASTIDSLDGPDPEDTPRV